MVDAVFLRVSDWPQRTNTYTADPVSGRYRDSDDHGGEGRFAAGGTDPNHPATAAGSASRSGGSGFLPSIFSQREGRAVYDGREPRQRQNAFVRAACLHT